MTVKVDLVSTSEMEKTPSLRLAARSQVEPLEKPVVTGHYTLFGA